MGCWLRGDMRPCEPAPLTSPTPSPAPRSAPARAQMAEAILEAHEPVLPPAAVGKVSPEFIAFARAALAHDPAARLTAHALLSAPWFALHGISSLADAAAVMADFLSGAGGGGAAGGAGDER